jgi:hypothetical protein
MGKILSFVTDWKNGLALLITAGLAIWLNPLEAAHIAIIFIVLVAAVHLLAAIWRALFSRKPKTEA